jgi:radical SAM protein with 4Fe4S-binding SPASM domain
MNYNPRVEVDIDRFIAYGNWVRHGYQTCWWSKLQTVITPNGKVWACVNKREFPEAELGDLNNESFADIWARVPVQKVNDRCRVFCRGHIPNQMLSEIMTVQVHGNFV